VLKRIVLAEDLLLTGTGLAGACFGVDEGMVHFGPEAYADDEDFGLVMDGTRTVAQSGHGAARGGWVQVVPSGTYTEWSAQESNVASGLFRTQSASGARTHIIGIETSRTVRGASDFVVIPGIGGIQYSGQWEECVIFGPGKECRDLVEAYHEIRAAAIEVSPRMSAEEIAKIVQGLATQK
jgi:hypothetical protein